MRREITGVGSAGDATFIHVVESIEQTRVCKLFFEQMINLYQQLTEGHLAERNFVELVGSGNNRFILITQGTNLLATATFIFVKHATKKSGFIEDVVVDAQYRKYGLGKVLIETALELGRVSLCHYAQLTSRPERNGTVPFYLQLGFELIAQAHGKNGTNLYRYHYPSPKRK
jgi:ribosomal protein S18 acetylase RimI-like enzyme